MHLFLKVHAIRMDSLRMLYELASTLDSDTDLLGDVGMII